MSNIRNLMVFMISILLVCLSVFFENTYLLIFLIIVIGLNMLLNQTRDISTFSIFFLSAFLPFYAIIRAFLQLESFEILSFYVNYIRDFVILFCFIMILLKQSTTQIIKNRNTVDKHLMLGINLLLVNYIYGFVISLVNGYTSLGIKGVHLNIIPILLVYIISNSAYIDEKIIAKFIKSSIMIGLIVSVIGMVLYLVKPVIFGQLFLIFSQQDESNFLQALNYSRMVGTFLSPNVFGSYMAILLLLTIHEAINNKMRSFLAVIFIVMFSVCLILSFSRGAWAFAISGIFIFLLLSRNKFSKKQVQFAILSLISVIAIALIMPFVNRGLGNYLLERFSSIFDFSNESSYGRSGNWQGVIASFSSNIFGLGLGIASINLLSYPELAQKLGVNVVDGYYIKIIAETGIVGMILFSGFLLLTIHSLIRLTKKTSNATSSTYALITAIFLGFVVQSFGSNTFDFVNISPFLWIYIGFAIKLNRL